MARERKIFTVDIGTDMSNVMLPGSDIPMYMEYLTSDSGFVELNLSGDANTAPKNYPSGIEDPNFDTEDLRNFPLLTIGQTDEKIYYSVWTTANTNGYSEVSMPLSEELSKTICITSSLFESRLDVATANVEFANVGVTLTTDDIKDYYDNEL